MTWQSRQYNNIKNVPANTILGNNTGSTAAAIALTDAQCRSALSLGGAALLNVGTSTGTVCAGDDSRLSDARTPSAHASTHASGGSDPITVSQSQVTSLTSDLALKAPLASPTFTGTPAAPTATAGDNTTKIATTAFVNTALSGLSSGAITINNLDCSTNPNYPTGAPGTFVYITVAGKIGGASGISVDVGDVAICKTTNAGGDQATVGSSWFIVEHNIAGALQAANNLSELASASTARTNLGLGTAATQNTGTSGGNIPLLNAANTYSGASTFSAAGAASTPGVLVSGAPYTGGTGTTNFPQLYVNSGASGPTTFSTSGTMIGVNAPSGFAGNLIDAHTNGGASLFSVTYNGNTTANALFSLGGVQAAASSYHNWSGRSRLYSSADGKIHLTDSAGTAFTMLSFGGTSSSEPALKKSSAALVVRLADDSANAALTASTLTASGLSSGMVKNTSGLLGTATAGTDYVEPGGALGTPSSGTLTSCTGLPISSLTSGTVASGVGANQTPYSAGTKSSGTYTPDAANGNFQYITNGGAFTLAPPSSACSMIVEVANNGSAGTITTSSFTKVSGDSFDTTNAHKFFCFIVKHQNYSSLNVQALQ